MEVKAKAKYLRVAPKKVRLVANLIKGMDVERALFELAHLRKDAKICVIKLLNSAIANAEHNFSLKKENLFIKHITADGGPILHRSMARAHGSAAPIRKRTTHLTLVLAESVPKEEARGKESKKPAAKPVKKPVVKKEEKISKK